MDIPKMAKSLLPVIIHTGRAMAEVLVAGLSMQRPRPVHVGFVVDEMALGQVFLQVVQFSLSVSFHHFSPHSYMMWDLGDEQYACWWLRFRDTVSSH
jgi:hypothetical protein